MNGTLIIIGNGFDLNLGLATSYMNFIHSECFNSLFNSKNNYLANHLKKVGEISTWIDAEQEIYKYYLKNKNNSTLIPRLLFEFNTLKNALLEYILSLDLNQINNDSHAFSWAQNLNPLKEASSQPLYVLNFNYTNTFEKISRNQQFINKWSNVYYMNEHGSILDKNIILGLSDQVELGHNVNYLRKSSFPNYGKEINEYILEKCVDVYFYGHSLGESDHNYFKSFFVSNTTGDRNLSPPKTLTVFHYGLDSYYDINNQLWELTNNNTSKFKIRNEVTFIDLK